MMTLLLFLLAFLLLTGGSELISRGTSSIARHMSISETMIGMTIIAFSTSAPEFLVNIFASINGHSDISFGNIIGSNIFNLFVITGIIGTFSQICLKRSIIFKLLPFSIVTTLIFWIIINDVAFFGSETNTLSQLDGGILVLGLFQFFIFFFIYQAAMSKIREGRSYEVRIPDLLTKPYIKKEPEAENSPGLIYSIPFSVFCFIIGLVLVIAGGYLVVREAVEVSMQFNTSLKLLSVCVISVLTSVPELIVSYISARRGQSDLAVANILGSNIFNIAFIMGLSALIRPLAFNTAFNTDILVLLIGTSALYLFCYGEKSVQHIEAVSLPAIYAAYFVFVIMRG